MANTPNIDLELIEDGEGDPRLVVNRNSAKLDLLVPSPAQRAAYDAALSPIACRVYNNATQSVPHNVLTALNFNSERFDIGELHAATPNPNRITCAVGGIYQITGQIAWPQLADNTRRQIQIRLNGGAAIGATETFASSGSGLFLTQVVTTLWQLNAGDYIELACFQNSGAALTLPAAAGSQEFMMARV